MTKYEIKFEEDFQILHRRWEELTAEEIFDATQIDSDPITIATFDNKDDAIKAFETDYNGTEYVDTWYEKTNINIGVVRGKYVYLAIVEYDDPEDPDIYTMGDIIDYHVIGYNAEQD